jgi:hypothetical protein
LDIGIYFSILGKNTRQYDERAGSFYASIVSIKLDDKRKIKFERCSYYDVSLELNYSIEQATAFEEVATTYCLKLDQVEEPFTLVDDIA